MATLEDIVAELQRKVDALTTPPTDYYTHRWSGEEIDNAVDRSRIGGAIDSALSNKVEWDSGFLSSGSILDWAETQTINTHIATNSGVTGFLYETAWAVDFYLYPAGGWRRLIATDIQLGVSYYCIKNASQPWSTWTPIATATPPQEYDLPLADGLTPTQPSKYYKDQFGVVHIGIAVKATTTHTDGSLIATMPEGFRPSQITEQSAVYKNGDAIGTVQIMPNGQLIFFYANGMIENQVLFGTLDFVAGS